jgi:hypothetical protein
LGGRDVGKAWTNQVGARGAEGSEGLGGKVDRKRVLRRESSEQIAREPIACGEKALKLT